MGRHVNQGVSCKLNYKKNPKFGATPTKLRMLEICIWTQINKKNLGLKRKSRSTTWMMVLATGLITPSHIEKGETMMFLRKPHTLTAGFETGTHAWLARQSGALSIAPRPEGDDSLPTRRRDYQIVEEVEIYIDSPLLPEGRWHVQESESRGWCRWSKKSPSKKYLGSGHSVSHL